MLLLPTTASGHAGRRASAPDFHSPSLLSAREGLKQPLD
ncbi:hypothetical protein AtDm6_1097 [Acetobacter tropicalis]|uniref:Uncharacterized protein n=1 Tax=Acetobacter tropicalis TaxID=104102 RepID=A0A094YT08_9PROT|nr:hypothetical protein AtDm6_1097 [Acetobacter tropicalis]